MEDPKKMVQELLFQMADTDPADSFTTMDGIAGQLSALGPEAVEAIIEGVRGNLPEGENRRKEGRRGKLHKEYSRQCSVKALGLLGDRRAVDPILEYINSYLERFKRGKREFWQNEDGIGEVGNSYDREMAEAFKALAAIGDTGAVRRISASLKTIVSFKACHNIAEQEGLEALRKMPSSESVSALKKLLWAPGSRRHFNEELLKILAGMDLNISAQETAGSSQNPATQIEAKTGKWWQFWK